MRTQTEILDRYKERKERDFLGFEVDCYISYLDFENAKPFLKKGTPAADWKPAEFSELKQIMVDYMPFAWDKANNCRGLSASRSISHYVAWLWLYGSPLCDVIADIKDYEFYGKDKLILICGYLGLDPKQWDDGHRVNSEKG